MTSGTDHGYAAPAARSTARMAPVVPGPSDGSATAAPVSRPPAVEYQRIALVDLLDRLLAGGVVISGEIRLSIADVDLVTISLRALIASVSSALDPAPSRRTPDDQ